MAMLVKLKIIIRIIICCHRLLRSRQNIRNYRHNETRLDAIAASYAVISLTNSSNVLPSLGPVA